MVSVSVTECDYARGTRISALRPRALLVCPRPRSVLVQIEIFQAIAGFHWPLQSRSNSRLLAMRLVNTNVEDFRCRVIECRMLKTLGKH